MYQECPRIDELSYVDNSNGSLTCRSVLLWDIEDKE